MPSGIIKPRWRLPRKPTGYPTCPRCGRVRQSWLRKHRRHAGSLLMAGCCCNAEVDCQDVSPIPTTIPYTIAGMDATANTTCNTIENNAAKFGKAHTLAIDGSGTLTQTGGPFSGFYTYAKTYTGGSFGTYEIWFDDPFSCPNGATCSSLPSCTLNFSGTWDTLAISTSISWSSGTYEVKDSLVTLSDSGNGDAFRSAYRNPDSVPNDEPCTAAPQNANPTTIPPSERAATGGTLYVCCE